MASTKLIQESPIPLPELKEKLETIEKRDKELTFRGNKVRDYLNKLVKLDIKQSAELKKKLQDLEIPRVKDRQIIKIIDILPEDIEDLRAVFTGETTTVTQENLERIVTTVKDYLPKRRKK
jgi:DNA-directed RNA polymerase subunit F